MRGCRDLGIKGTGIDEVKEKAVAAAQKKVQNKRVHSFDQAVEDAIDSVSAKLTVEERKRDSLRSSFLKKTQRLQSRWTVFRIVKMRSKHWKTNLMMIQRVLSPVRDMHISHLSSENV